MYQMYDNGDHFIGSYLKVKEYVNNLSTDQLDNSTIELIKDINNLNLKPTDIVILNYNGLFEDYSIDYFTEKDLVKEN